MPTKVYSTYQITELDSLRARHELTRGYIFKCEKCGMYKVSSEHKATPDGNICLGCNPQPRYIWGLPSMIYGKDQKYYDETNELFFGLEIEFISNSKWDRVKMFNYIYNYSKEHELGFIVKSEGGQDGEINSIPNTAPYFLQHMKDFWKSGVFSEDIDPEGTGMHVHVNKTSLGSAGIGKLIRFYNNSNHHVPIQGVAGRTGRTWSVYLQDPPVYLSSTKKDTIRRDYDFYNGGKGYTTSVRRSTVEFRLFASPSNYEEFASRLQLLWSSILYLNDKSLGHVQREKNLWSEYSKFVKDNKRRFAELNNVIHG